MITDYDHSRLVLFINSYFLHLGGPERLGDELRLVFAPFDYIDLLTPEFVHDLSDSGSTGTDARSLGVNIRVIRRHGYLRPIAGFARYGLDLNGSIDEFRNLELQQPANEIRMTTADHNLRALCLIAYLEDKRLHPVAAFQPLVRDSLRSRQQRFRIAEIENGVPVVDLLDDPCHEIALAAFVYIEDLIAFSFPQSLRDHLLSRLSGDTAEIVGSVFPLLDDVPLFVEFLGIDDDIART